MYRSFRQLLRFHQTRDSAEGTLRTAVADTVRAEAVAAIYKQLPVTLSMGVVNAVLAAAVLAGQVGRLKILTWLAAVIVLAGLRALTCLRFSTAGRVAHKRRVWEVIIIAGTASSGVLWGLLGSALLPPLEQYRVFVAFVIGFMCAAGAAIHSAYVPMVVAFNLPAILPLAVSFAAIGTQLCLVMAIMTAVYGVMLILVAMRYGSLHASRVRLTISLGERSRELSAANERLRAEMREHRTTEAALRQSQKLEAVGRLTAGIAHDFNNLLMVISGSAELLQRRLGAEGSHDRSLANIAQASARGAQLTRQLLAFSRRQSLQPAVFDLNAAVRGVASMLAPTLGKSVTLRLELDAAPLRTFVDRGELDRALINIAINARDAMAGSGTLTLRTGRTALSGEVPDLPAGPYAWVAAVDTGSGMTEEVRQRAFDPFFTTKPPGEGTGLGLSQVYGVMRQSGGTVTIDTAVGRGTTVTLWLPLVAALGFEETTVGPDAGMPALDGDRRVVVVDDEAMVLEVVTEVLSGAGYSVVPCANGQEALTRIASGPVDLLVTDLAMPDLSGEEVANRARALRPALPVVFITGYDADGRLAGERWRLRKPFQAADLLAIVARAIGSAGAAAESAAGEHQP
jgi:signal transduction histidine kinase